MRDPDHILMIAGRILGFGIKIDLDQYREGFSTGLFYATDDPFRHAETILNTATIRVCPLVEGRIDKAGQQIQVPLT